MNVDDEKAGNAEELTRKNFDNKTQTIWKVI